MTPELLKIARGNHTKFDYSKELGKSGKFWKMEKKDWHINLHMLNYQIMS